MNDKRYIRQIALDQIGQEGQSRIANASVAVIGCGGLGAIAATYLAGAGIGKLVLVDGDVPDDSNLHRQVVFMPGTESTKAEALSGYLTKFNPDITVKAVPQMADKSNIMDIIEGMTVVMECTDDLYTKYLVNDACCIKGIPLVYGAIHKYDGYVSFFNNDMEESIHLRDIFPDPDTSIPSCEEVGVMNTLAGIIGLLQANEVLKYVTGAGKTLDNELLIYDNLNNTQVKMKLKKTWKKDINEVWNTTKYDQAIHCDIPEITVEELLHHQDQFTLVSILNGENHESISPDTVHIPAANFNIYDWDPDEEKTTVIYCTSGKVSLQLALSLKEEYPESEFLSLKGGIKAYRKYQGSG